MILFWALLGSLGAYRLGHMLTQERGPFDVFLRFRNIFTQEDWLGHGVRCLHCVSFWIAAGMAALLPVASLKEFFLLWFGMAGAVIILDRYWRR